MPQCSSCATDIPEKSRFCLQCGKPAGSIDPESIETQAVAMSQPRGGSANERFAPGTLLVNRYRIVSRLGKGGMGEVFRADDLILGQPVALKFLPEAARDNINLLARFYDEVRIARQISHKNVCRVYDIGEVNGQPFLSMEYIDGEDLGSLLRRIGRLPADKATEFGRKLCAGVAAAHAQGILHRDIKPANIMIDARGELRITDFGLAAIAEQLQGAEIRNGTPAYMAPEQLAGEHISVQSDLYAVGLVLYEIFTGKPPFQASTLAEMIHARQENRLTSPSALVADLGKDAEGAILRCLEADPKMRPQSALALAAMLPGGDPLAAALAEGETPSPEAVAAAGSNAGLAPKVAIGALAGIAVGFLALCLALPRQYLINLTPMENPPEVLAAKARDLARNLGYTERPADRIYGFFSDPAITAYLRSKGHNIDEWARAFQTSPSSLGFWYRQSPELLVAERATSDGAPGITDPPVVIPGMISIAMEMDGRLRRFAAVPSERGATGEVKPADWSALFTAAQLDMGQFKPVSPEWTPPLAADARAAWTGRYPGRPDLPVRIEAASFGGRPVFFQIFWPWTRSTRLTAPATTWVQRLSNAAYYAGTVMVLMAAFWIAHYNWRAGRSDLRGATRIGIFCAGLSLISWVLAAHHVSSRAEQDLIAAALSKAAFIFIVYWVFYLALEPWVRKYWPQTMITWSRVLAGRWRDPLVGRDVLFGVLFGAAYLLLLMLFAFVQMRGGVPLFSEFNVTQLRGFRSFSGSIVATFLGDVTGSLMFFLTLFLLRALVKKQWLAALIWVAAWPTVRMLRSNPLPLITEVSVGFLWVAIFTVLVLIMLRYGFFALVVTVFVLDSVSAAFLTTDFSAWYGQSSLAVLVLVAALALWGFRYALTLQQLPVERPGAFTRL